jgi:hypothetical protein
MSGDSENAVFNGSIRHAQIVVEEAFKAATNRVLLLTENLDQACYDSGSVIDAARSFLCREGARLLILIESTADEMTSSAFLRSLKEFSARVDVRYVPKSVSAKYSCNFMVVDEKACRYEANRATPEAVVFGGGANLTTVKHLADVFLALHGATAEYAHAEATA